MKIGFVLDDSLDRPDGVQQYVLTMGEWLASRGHSIHYLVGQTFRTDIPQVYSLGRTLRVPINGNVAGTPLPANKADIIKLLDKLKLDILHVQLPYSPVLAGRVVQSAGIHTAVVGTLHIYPNTKLEHLLNRGLTLVNKRTLRRFAEIVAVSNVAAAASHMPNKDEIRVIPNPVDIKRFQRAAFKPAQARKIVFLGRLVPRKGCLLLLQSVARLVGQNKFDTGWTVDIGGTGPLKSKLENFVAKHGLKQIVCFRGFIDEADKQNFLASADIAVFPSTSGESFGIVLLEAMASGVMVLAGNNPGYTCVLGKDSQQLFSTKQPDELAGMLEAAMASTVSRQKIVKLQNKLVATYDIKHIGPQIEAVYTKALHSRIKMG